MKRLEFKCRRCGHCCRNLVKTTPTGRTLGLFLLPHETHLFPKDDVYPMYGYGLKGRARPRPAQIYVYQYGRNVCCHITEENLCKLHPKKPLICRTFPLMYYPELKEAVLSRDCLFMHDNIEENERVEKLIAPNEMAAVPELEHYLDRGSRHPPYWTWDLEQKKWVPLRMKDMVELIQDWPAALRLLT